MEQKRSRWTNALSRYRHRVGWGFEFPVEDIFFEAKSLERSGNAFQRDALLQSQDDTCGFGIIPHFDDRLQPEHRPCDFENCPVLLNGDDWNPIFVSIDG